MGRKKKEVKVDLTVEENFQERNHIEEVRGIEPIERLNINKIDEYYFAILIRDEETLTGRISREEMDLIYRLYSSKGANLSQTSVARNFPQYTENEFKKILRAFNIKKDSLPRAPHIIEEMTNEEAVTLTLNLKKKDFLKKLDEEDSKRTKQEVKDLIKKLNKEKEKVNDIKSLLKEIEIPKFESRVQYSFTKEDNKTALIIPLSDLHVGASVSKYSMYDNEYNEEEVMKRFDLIIDEIYRLHSMFDFSRIVVLNLGDSLDGYNGQTARGGHDMPQNMDNKEQVKVFTRQMFRFFDLINQDFTTSYYCVGESNHDGDFGWLANEKLASMLEVVYPDMKVKVFDTYINYFKVGETTIVLSHGKDNETMFKNLPLTINKETENKIIEYLDYNNINGNVIFIKGDLHQSALTYSRRFTYWSVGSFFGSSQWIQTNFGNTKACCDLGILRKDNNFISSRIILN